MNLSAARSALIFAAASLAGCSATHRPAGHAGGDPAFRVAQPRRAETIFTPLDLPAPSELRLASGAPGPAYWQQRADYAIDATLDEERRRIHATAVITYTNNSPHELDYLWLHLEQNLFRADSVGSRMVPPNTRFANRTGFEGGFEIESVRLAGPVEGGERNPSAPVGPGADLALHVYDTVGRIDLPVPVRPRGGRLVIEIRWSFTIPTYGADRMGIDAAARGPIFQIAQWFPAVAVYDDVHGWHTDPYLGQGEFYTDFGDFDVRLTVPRSHIVVATGELANPADVLTPAQLERLDAARHSAGTVVIRAEEEVDDPASRPPGDGPLTWRFTASNVRTFAWASSRAFLWDAAFLDTSGPVRADGSRAGTLVQSVYPGEALRTWPGSTAMLRSAIDGYNRRWFVYPYPTATNVNGIVGGMEYPMIIFCGGRRDERGLFGVTTHEIGHNWFPMIVSSDERRHAWMDEGFNTFINFYSWEERFGTSDGRRGNARPFADSMLLPDQQPMDTPADQVRRDRLGILQYEKTSVGLVMLREVILGPERFDRAFREYIRRWAFRHPQPADFFRTIEDVSGAELSWFWRGWFLETGTLDQAVESVTHSGQGRPRAALRNLGRLVMPVEMEVRYNDGSTETRRLPVEVWYTSDRWVAEWDAGGRRVVALTLDPRGVLPDTNPSNNAWPSVTAPAAK